MRESIEMQLKRDSSCKYLTRFSGWQCWRRHTQTHIHAHIHAYIRLTSQQTKVEALVSRISCKWEKWKNRCILGMQGKPLDYGIATPNFWFWFSLVFIEIRYLPIDKYFIWVVPIFIVFSLFTLTTHKCKMLTANSFWFLTIRLQFIRQLI